MWDIYISAIGAVVCVILGSLLTLLNSWIQRKSDFQDKRINDTYQKRIRIYEEVYKAVASMTSRENLPSDCAARYILFKITEYVHVLNSFSFSLALLGNENVVTLIDSFILEMKKKQENGKEELPESNQVKSLRSFLSNAVEGFLKDFTAVVREEIGAVALDKRIRKAIIADTPKKKKVKRNSRHVTAPID